MKTYLPFKYDMAKYNWTLLEDVSFDGKQFIPDLVEFLQFGESPINGEVMKQRAKELNAHLGQHHAEYLLEHKDLIPEEWRGKYYLPFPGTVWQASVDNCLIPCLFWLGARWCLDFRWLGLRWCVRVRLVGIRK